MISRCGQCEKYLPEVRYNAYMTGEWDACKYDKFLCFPKDRANELAGKIATCFGSDTNSRRILLCGVGSGRIEVPLIQSLSSSISISMVDVVDINAQLLEHFEKKVSGLEAVHFCIHQTPLEKFFQQHKERYDLITAFFVLYLIPSWHEIVEKTIIRLKNNGCILLAEEIGDFRAVKICPSESQTEEEKSLREIYKRFWDNLTEEMGAPLYSLQSFSDLGLLRDILRLLEIGGFVSLEYEDIWWKNNEITFEELIEIFSGKSLATATVAVYSKNSIQEFCKRFQDRVCDWDRVKGKKIPRKEGHRFWTIRLNESPEVVAEQFGKVYKGLVTEFEIHQSALGEIAAEGF